MGFLFKKVIATLLMPLPTAIFLGLVGLFFLSRAKVKQGTRWILGSMVWIFLFSYAPFGNLLLYQIEHQYPALGKASPDTRYIYVLGSGHHTDSNLPITAQLSSEAVVRLNEGIRLYRQLEGKAKLILSGYSGLSDPTPHALMQKKLAVALGIPAGDILMQPEAMDTQDEAEAAKKITQGKPLILVTSAYHMPRAVQWFNHAKLSPIPAPTYHQASLTHPNYLDILSAGALTQSTIAFHEFLGILWQKIKGV